LLRQGGFARGFRSRNYNPAVVHCQ
jgi:hypothetical protein